MSKIDKSRNLEPDRRMVTVTLGGKSDGGRSAVVLMPAMSTMPDIIRYRDRLFIKRNERTYAVAKVWPLNDSLDKISEDLKATLVD